MNASKYDYGDWGLAQSPIPNPQSPKNYLLHKYPII